MLIKVCGVAEAANASRIAGLGPDLMGFIFYRPSPRNAFALPRAAVRELPGTIKKVGVFVDEAETNILRTCTDYGLDFVQLHGSEPPALCRRLGESGLGVIKAFGISSAEDIDRTEGYEECCDLFVFDTKTAAKGGSGRKFDHSVLVNYTGATPFLLSGGIGPQDSAVDLSPYTQCAGLDLNSRFETSPGIKNAALLKTFMETIRKRYEQDR